MTLIQIMLAGLCTLVRPTAARCPFDMDLRTGIRRDGSFECWPHPVKVPGMTDASYMEFDGTFGRPERSVQPAWLIRGWLYCPLNTQPLVIDWHTVGCR